MSLEINKKGLSGNAIRVLENAKIEADLNKDGKIEGEQEISIFNKHIENSPALTKSERKQILGEKKVKEDSEAKQERQEKRADKKDEKSSKELFNNTLKTLADTGIERDKVVEALRSELIANNADPDAEAKYNALIKIVEGALAKVKIANVEATSMDQIDAYFQKLINNSKDQTERKVLRQVAQMVKNEKVNAAKDDISNRYASKLKDAEEKGLKVTDKEIMDEILKELKDEGKYVIDSNYGERNQNAYVTAYKNFNNGEIAKQARILLANVINGKTNPEEVEGSKIHKEAKEWLKAQGLWDKNVAKANRKHRFGRKTSNAEGIDRNIALNTIKSHDELKKVFGSNADAKIKALMDTQVALTDDLGQTIVDENGEPVMFNLVTIREDGYYDLTNLSRIAGQQAGADNTFNKHKHDVNSEYGYLERALNGAIIGQGLDLSDKEIQDLVKAMGYPEKGAIYNFLKGLAGAAAGALAHGATAGVATWSNPYQTYLDCPPEMEDIKIQLDLKKILGENAYQEWIENGYNISAETSGYVEILIKDLLANEKAFTVILPKLIKETAIKSALLGAVLGLLAGFQEYEEKPAVPLKVEQTNLKDYSETLKASKETAKYAPLLTSLALVKGFVSEDGTLDNVGFQNYLHRIFAGNDILNKDEFAALEKMYLESTEHRLVKTKPVKETKEIEEKEEKEEKDVALVEKENKPVEEITYVDDFVVYTREAGDGWAGIIEEYYPDLLKKYNGRMYDYWKDGKRVAKGAVGALKDALGAADPAVLKQLRNGGDIPERLNLPKTIEGTSINPNAKQVKKTTIVKGGSTTLKEAGEKKQKSVVTYSPGLDLYIACDEAEPGKKYTGATEDEAIKELEKATGKDFEEVKRTNYKKEN